MGLIKKRGLETLDYTYLQKKGFIKKPAEKTLPYKVDSHGMMDLTSLGAMSNTNVQETAPTSNESSSNPFSFMDNLATSATNAPSSFLSEQKTEVDNQEVSALKIKIDDLEFKLAQLIDKLSMIESKLGNFERRMFS